MRYRVLGAAAVLVAVAQPAAPQARVSPPTGSVATDVPDDARRILGITVSTSGTDRDTLGLLISTVIPGGPAERGSIDPGNRLSEINGTSLRTERADVGRGDAQDEAMRRLGRALHAVQPGDNVTLRVYGGGRFRTVTIASANKPADAPAPSAPSAPAAHPASLKGVIDGISDLRTQLDRLLQDKDVTAPRDTLMWAALELGAIERRLRATQPEPKHADSAATELPGMRVAAVGDELTDYFGEESKGGLLVVECDSTWDPVRKGDVILRLNGDPASLAGLRGAVDPKRQTKVDLLRRGRALTVTLHAYN